MPRPYLISLTLVALACQTERVARIGDAYPDKDWERPTVNVVRAVFDSLPSRSRPVIEPWHGGGPGGVDRAWEEANLFGENPDVVAVVGHPGSRDALLGARVYNALGVPQVVPAATSSRLTQMGPWTYVLVPDNGRQGDLLAAYAVDSLGAKRVTVFYVGDEYGAELRDGIAAGLRSRSLELADAVLVPGVACDATSPELFRVLAMASFKRVRPDVVVLAVGSSGGTCLAEPILTALPGVHVLAADGVDPHAPGVRTLPDSLRARLHHVVFWRPGTDSLNRAFMERWHRISDRVPIAHEALQYDAYMLLAAAIRDVGSDRAAIRGWLESLGRSRPAFQGVTGPIAFVDRRRALDMQVVTLSPEP